jgi:hypothetical protein
VPDFESFIHPDPNFPAYWATKSLALAAISEGSGDLSTADTHRRVLRAEMSSLTKCGYTLTQLQDALDKATRMQAAISELEDLANGGSTNE